MSKGGFWRWVDWGGRVEFLGTIFDFLVDWRSWLSSIIFGGAVTFLWSAIEGKSPSEVWLMALIATAAFLLLIAAGMAVLRGLRSRRLAIAKALDDLYAEGVGHRNRLIPVIVGFDHQQEEEKLGDWSNRVMAQCDDRYVAMREKSAFRTLNLFTPRFANVQGKDPRQAHCEAMWTEKLERLKIIIGHETRPAMRSNP
jgi:hypothetical protein